MGEIELPDAVLKDYLKMQNENLTDENIDEEYTRMRPDLVWQLIREAVARQLEVKATAEDMKTFARQIAASRFAQYGMAGVPENILDKYAEEMLANEQTRRQIADQVFDSMMWGALKEAVTTDDKTVTVEQFNELFKTEE